MKLRAGGFLIQPSVGCLAAWLLVVECLVALRPQQCLAVVVKWLRIVAERELLNTAEQWIRDCSYRRELWAFAVCELPDAGVQ